MIRLLPPSMPREAFLVVLCARTSPDARCEGRIGQLAQGPTNWAYLAEIAKWHGVAPMVYRNLSRLCRDRVWPIVLEDLKQYYQASAMLGHSLARDLAMLCQSFAARGITVVPFKGLTLAQTAYGDIAARECGDIDMIVRRDDLARARGVLQADGYECATDDAAKASDPTEAFNLYIKRTRGVTVDMQWVMADGSFAFRLDRARFWQRLTTLRISGAEVKALAPEDLLLVLCVHGAKHVFEQLKWIGDVAELLHRHPNFDWVYFERTAREWSCWRMVLVGLTLARTLWGTHLPARVERAIMDDREVPALARRMPKTLLGDPRYGLGEEEREVFYFATKDSRWHQWKHGLSLSRDRNLSLTVDHPWLPAWRRLQGIHRAIDPLRGMLKRMIPSTAIRQRLSRWLLPAS